MSKVQKVFFNITLCFFALLSGLVVFWYFCDDYGDFYTKANKEFEIVGLVDGFTPQGLTYEANTNIFLTCGYMRDNSESRIYVIDASTHETTKYFTLKNEDSAYTGHAGGIETDGNNVWIAGDGLVLRFYFSDISSVENGGSISIVDTFKSKNGADFLTLNGDYLWIGEFHRTKSYDTDETHHITTSSGEINKAISFCHRINNESTCAIEEIPTKALSTSSLVQGMIITDQHIIHSTSYSLPNSKIKMYQNILDLSTEQTFNYNGTDIDLYILEEPTNTIDAPCMTEEIVYHNGRVYILFENACQKYKYFTREQNKFVYSYEI